MARVIAVASVVAALPLLCSAQAPRGGATQVPCTSCVIKLTPTLTIDGRSAGSRIGQFSELYRLKSGRFVVGALADKSHALYEPNGAFVARFGSDVKREKNMPIAARIIGGERDSIYMYDNFLEREIVFSPSLKTVRSRSLPITPFSVLRLPNDTLLILSRSDSAPASGYPFHIVDGAGRITRSFGADYPLTADQLYNAFSWVVPSRDSTAFWTFHRNRYAIEKWSIDGHRLLSVQRDVDWFPPRQRESDAPIRAVKPQPRIVSVWEGDHGLLWTIVSVPKVDWKPTVQRRPRDEEDLPTLEDMMMVYDSIIEVIEPTTSRLVASSRLSDLLGYFVADGVVVGMRLQARQPVLQLRQVVLESGPSRRH